MAAEKAGADDGSGALPNRVVGVRRTLPELQDGLLLYLGDVRSKLSRFWILLVLAAIIATAGVLANSTATVIGAMIVAPLGTPIMGVSLAAAISRPGAHRYRHSRPRGRLPGQGPPGVAAAHLERAGHRPDLAQRHRPDRGGRDRIRGLVRAGPQGRARRHARGRDRDLARPSLAVAGITAAAGDWGSAWGAFLLFASNVVAMILAGTIVFTLYGYRREAKTAPSFRKRPAYAVIGAALVLILVPLGLTTARKPPASRSGCNRRPAPRRPGLPPAGMRCRT
jgi:hypothetical protein